MPESHSPNKRRRLIPRFNLRDLAFAVLLIAIVLSYLYSPIPQGAQRTGRELDVAIFGRGYFRVISPSGREFYTRRGRFTINANGALCIGSPSDGLMLSPQITVSSDQTSIIIGKEGEVMETLHGTDWPSSIGALGLTSFVTAGEGLKKVGPDTFVQTAASGTPTDGMPGTGGLGYLKQGWLETPGTFPLLTPFFAVSLFLVVVVVYFVSEMRLLRSRLDKAMEQFRDRQE